MSRKTLLAYSRTITRSVFVDIVIVLTSVTRDKNSGVEGPATSVALNLVSASLIKAMMGVHNIQRLHKCLKIVICPIAADA